MTRVALHLNDAGIVLLDAARILYRQPGFALLTDDGIATGDAAFSAARISPRRVQHRYWTQVSTEPLAERLFSRVSTADLVSSQLEQLWRRAPDGTTEVVVAAPATMKPEALGLLLGIAGELNIPVIALADAAVAATRREYRNAAPVHIDVSLHHAMLTRLAQPGQVRVEKSEVIDECGVYAMFDAWLTTIAEAFVRQSRFDPLHTAATEQLLLDRLGGWLAEAARGDQVVMAIESGSITHSAEVESLSLIGAVAPWYQQIANRLRALCRADEVPAIQVTDRVARLPGLTDLLKARVGGEVYVLEAGATARGALARCRSQAASAAGVSLLKRLPWDQAAVAIEVNDAAAAKAGVPSHLLFGDVAYRLDNEPFEIGTQSGEDGRRIALAGDMPGVSRRHCSISRVNGQCVVEDHSRYGTFLNGHRINGSTVLEVGDALRIGTPGYEFRLITTDESHGA